MNTEQIAQHIEAILFSLGKPVARAELARMLGIVEDGVQSALELLGSRTGSGVVVVDDGTMLELRAAPEAAETIERIRKEEFTREVGRAGQETLAALLYKGPLSRSDIDFIRGVNSSQILRTLTMRGLVRRVENPKDARAFLYEPTTELLATLGITHLGDLPDYATVREKLTAFETTYREKA
ncbi:MAG: SMC-Scp complex subunit ScpB [bacterium]